MTEKTTQAKVRAILYKSKTLSNGEHPIMIRINKDGKRTYQSLGISCKADEWDEEERLPIINHEYRASYEKLINDKLKLYSDEKINFQLDGKDYTTHSLIQAVEKPLQKRTVFEFFNETVERLRVSGKIGYSNSFKDTLISLKSFTKNKDLKFAGIDYNFLTNYETFLRQRSLQETSMCVYFTNIRTIYNNAIKAKIAREANYPFKDFKISKFNLDTRKRAITKEKFLELIALETPDGYYYKFAKVIMKTIYYGRGINFIDIAHLKWSDIIGDRILYSRKKTKKLLNIKINTVLLSILEDMKNLTFSGNKEDYIFPILNKQRHITPIQIDNRVHKVEGKVNKYLKKIGVLAGLPFPLTTYVLRHTFATAMKKGKTDVERIREALGQRSVLVTQKYLADLEFEELDEVIEASL